MKKKEVIRAIKFTLFSISAGVIQIASYTLLLELVKLVHWQAYLISLLLSIIWNFTLNRRYTFKSAANVPIAMAKLLGFYLVFTPVSTYLGQLAVNGGVNEYIVEALTMFANFILEFLFCKFVMYRNKEDTLEK